MLISNTLQLVFCGFPPCNIQGIFTSCIIHCSRHTWRKSLPDQNVVSVKSCFFYMWELKLYQPKHYLQITSLTISLLWIFYYIIHLGLDTAPTLKGWQCRFNFWTLLSVRHIVNPLDQIYLEKKKMVTYMSASTDFGLIKIAMGKSCACCSRLIAFPDTSRMQCFPCRGK